MTPLAKRDQAALTLAVELYRAGSPTQRARIDAQLAKGDDWNEVARYCAFHMQVENLRLRPWQPPPCDVHVASALASRDDEPRRGYRSAALLVQQMLAAGLSRFEADPIGALGRAGHAAASVQESPRASLAQR